MVQMPSLQLLLIGIAAKIESRTRRPWFDLQRTYYYRDVEGVKSPEDLRKALEHFHVVVSESDLLMLYSAFPSAHVRGGFDFAAFASTMYAKESAQAGASAGTNTFAASQPLPAAAAATTTLNNNNNNNNNSNATSTSSLQHVGRQVVGDAGASTGSGSADPRTSSGFAPPPPGSSPGYYLGGAHVSAPLARFSETQVLSLGTAPGTSPPVGTIPYPPSSSSLSSTSAFAVATATPPPPSHHDHSQQQRAAVALAGPPASAPASASAYTTTTTTMASATGTFTPTLTATGAFETISAGSASAASAAAAGAGATRGGGGRGASHGQHGRRHRGTHAKAGATLFPLTYNRSHAGRYNEHVVIHPSSCAPVPKPYPPQEYAQHGGYVSTLEQPRFGTHPLPEFSEVARRHNISRQYNRTGVEAGAESSSSSL